MTVIPKSGGNTFSGTALLLRLQRQDAGNNYDAKQLSVLGKHAPALLVRDYQVSLGGPIMKDRIWFFFNYRAVDAADAQPGIFANKNAGDPDEVDLRAGSHAAGPRRSAPQDRVAAPDHADHAEEQADGVLGRAAAVQRRRLERRRPLQLATRTAGSTAARQVNGFFGAGPNSPETGDYASTHQSVRQANITSTATSKLLLEAGYGTYISQWGYTERPGNPTAASHSRAGTDDAVLRSPTATACSAATAGRTHGGRQPQVTARRTGPPGYICARTPGTPRPAT